MNLEMYLTITSLASTIYSYLIPLFSRYDLADVQYGQLLVPNIFAEIILLLNRYRKVLIYIFNKKYQFMYSGRHFYFKDKSFILSHSNRSVDPEENKFKQSRSESNDLNVREKILKRRPSVKNLK